MKKIILPMLLTILFALSPVFQGEWGLTGQTINTAKPRSGVAILMTGAAARIPQEAALLEELHKRGLLKNVVFISGVSSGALNAVLLNAILSGKMTWTEYKNILYNLKNNDVFLMEGGKIPVNTNPARQLYTKIFEKRLGYYKMGDLPIATNISITRLSDLGLTKTSYRMCSRKINDESDLNLSLVDVAMASTAFPVVFPSVKIKNVKTIPDVEFVDGGLGDDQIPYKALLQFEKSRGYGVEKVYIISRKSDTESNLSKELKGIGLNDNGMLTRMGISVDNVLKKWLIKTMTNYAKEAPELIPRTYVWIPEFKEDFLLFNFENLKDQYSVTFNWAKSNNPVKLGDYLLPYLLEKN